MRRECATQVYIAFYNEFQSRFGGPPTVRDLIGIFLSLELFPSSNVSSAPPELLAATAANVYYGTCVTNQGQSSECDGYDVIDFLQASAGWIQIGGSGVIDGGKLEELFNNLDSDNVQSNLPTDIELTDFVYYEEPIPIAWGNYYFGTEGFDYFTSNPSPSNLLHCDHLRYVQNGNPIDYIFVIVAQANDNPLTNYEMVGIPLWFTNYQSGAALPEWRVSC